MTNNFPKNFLWGSSTSSYQIEGASIEDGKGKSIWDTFTHTPGKIKNNENGDITANHYHLYKQDISLMKKINLHAYRFSIAWTRILPEGRGQLNFKGVDFYSNLIDELLKNNIKPFITLYHWDLPQKLQDTGGWSNRDIANIFSDYAELIAKKFSDRCEFISTFNEPSVFTIHGYTDGYMAPGIRDKEMYLASIHNVNLAHGLALQAIRSVSSKVNLGCVLNMQPSIPFSDEKNNIEASKIHDMYWNRAFANPMYLGKYPTKLESKLSKYIKNGDMQNIYQKNDYFGLNHYQHIRVKFDKNNLLGMRNAFFEEIPYNIRKDTEVTSMGWEIVPNAYYDQIMELKNLYGDPEIYLTENGCSYTDTINLEGKVLDDKRIEYFKKYISAVKKSIDDGAKVRGYFAWSLMDNFEWALGFEKRFGLIHIDFKSLKRTPKKSYYFYKKLIDLNAIPSKSF
ncbi:MAG: beta-glucosidase [Pelagibacteraceae bacterium]|nr:beta-glucosidase [Pelagibacteraceae bacterium]